MFAKEITYYTDNLVDKIDTLLNSKYFKTVRELYITGGLVGILFNKQANNYKKTGNTKKIFSDALNKEFEEIKYAATLASLINSNPEDELLMKKAFGDWYDSIAIDNSKKTEIEKYEQFYKYSISGINFIYDYLIKNENDNTDDIRINFTKLITEIESIKENSDKYNIIEEAFK